MEKETAQRIRKLNVLLLGSSAWLIHTFTVLFAGVILGWGIIRDVKLHTGSLKHPGKATSNVSPGQQASCPGWLSMLNHC